MYGKKRKLVNLEKDELLWKELSEEHSQSEQFSQQSQSSQPQEIDDTVQTTIARPRQSVSSKATQKVRSRVKPVPKKCSQPTLTQLCLDAGQKSIGSSRCEVCGMVYYPGQLAGYLYKIFKFDCNCNCKICL